MSVYIYTTYTPNKDIGKKLQETSVLPFLQLISICFPHHIVSTSVPISFFFLFYFILFFFLCSNFYHHTLVLSVLELHLNAINRYYFLSFFKVVSPPHPPPFFC